MFAAPLKLDLRDQRIIIKDAKGKHVFYIYSNNLHGVDSALKYEEAIVAANIILKVFSNGKLPKAIVSSSPEPYILEDPFEQGF